MAIKSYLALKAATFAKDNWEILLPVFLIIIILIFMSVPLFFSAFIPRVETSDADLYKNVAEQAELPFDQLLVVDVVKNYGKNYKVTVSGLKKAALDFYSIKVIKYKREYLPTPTPVPSPTPGPSPARDYKMVKDSVKTYLGTNEILGFLKGAGYNNIINKPFSDILGAFNELDASEYYDISINKLNYIDLISQYDESLIEWAEAMVKNDIINSLYK